MADVKSSPQVPRGPVHELDAGKYRAVMRDGVPMIERENTGSCVSAVYVPVSVQLLDAISAEWSEPLQFRIEDGEFVLRRAECTARLWVTLNARRREGQWPSP